MTDSGWPLYRRQGPTSGYPEEGDLNDVSLNTRPYEEQEAFNLANRNLGQL